MKTKQKLTIEAGQQYKVEHKETKQTQILNAQQLAKFVFKNDYQNYNIIELNKKTLIDYIPLWFMAFLMVIAFIGSILLHIQLNY
tara:strand:- start:488 stop:742 length:255 start_codon:yes stop_codon:yes gene_type:complete